MASVITPVISVSNSLLMGQGLEEDWNIDGKKILVNDIFDTWNVNLSMPTCMLYQ